MLHKRNRLHKRGSFGYVYRKGESKADRALRITYVRSRGVPRIGISVPNTVGKAVVRNKIRRRIRAALRQLLARIRPAQIVVSVRKGAEAYTQAHIRETLESLFIKAGLYA